MTSSIPPSGSTSKLAFQGAVLVGKYRLEEIIGVGGMGSVWSATHLGLNQQIALKLVSSQFARSSDALRRFDNEAKAAAKIKSRHVPQVYDNGVLEDGTPFLAMELLHGETLFSRVHRGGPVPLAEAVRIIEHCCRGLGRAHSLGIIHRDIKPENIYLAQSVDDDDYVVKVLDFGIAKITSLEAGEQSTTRTGTLLGTPMFMSPEQARGLRTIDHRTDLYSLGLVTYMMFTGNVAFSGETLGELLLQICTQPLPSLLAGASWLPPGMEAWFQKACAREPENRFATAQAFVDSMRISGGLSAGAERSGSQLPVLPPSQARVPALGAPTGAMSLPLAPTAAQPAPAMTPSTNGAVIDGVVTGSTPSGRGRVIAAVASAVVGVALLAIAGMVVVNRQGAAPAPAVTPAAVVTAVPSSAVPNPSSVVGAAPAAETASASTPSATALAPPPAPTIVTPSTKPAQGQVPSGPGRGGTTAPATKPTSNPSKPGTVDLGY